MKFLAFECQSFATHWETKLAFGEGSWFATKQVGDASLFLVVDNQEYHLDVSNTQVFRLGENHHVVCAFKI
jgi:hypothetical protein